MRQVFLHKLNHYTTLEAKQGLAGSNRRFRLSDLAAAADLDVLETLTFLNKGFATVPRVCMFCALLCVSVAVRAWKHRELTLPGRTS